MSISVSGLGSGLDYQSWITKLVAIKQAEIDKITASSKKVEAQSSALSTVKSNYASLLTTVESFTDSLSSEDVFKQKAVTSSSDAVTANVTSTASVQSLKVSVTSLATSTKATSTAYAASAIDGSTKLSDIAGSTIKAGTFSVYVDGAKSSINITADETMDQVLTDLNNISGVTAALDADGKLTIGSSGASKITVGSSSDKSNFGDVMSLVAKTVDDVTTYSSSKSIFDTNTTALLTSASFKNGPVTAGTFTIGNAEFTVKADTTLESLIREINNNADAGVTASWDPNSGKINLESTDQGALNINVEAGTSNFTDVMGLTSGGNLAAGSQTLGTNAVLSINGTQITSSSNTVTSDISGIKGLTLTLNKETTSAASVAITNDGTAVTKALESFVKAYNTAVDSSTSATSATGYLHGETVLNSLKTSVKSIVSTTGGDNATFKMLASIGITSGKPSTDLTQDTSHLVIDTAVLQKALADNPDAVKNLLLGDKTTGSVGVFTKLDTALSNATNATSGYFAKRAAAYDKQDSLLADKIAKKTKDLTTYQSKLETKYAAMDKIISNLNSQSATLDSFFTQVNGSSSSNK